MVWIRKPVPHLLPAPYDAHASSRFSTSNESANRSVDAPAASGASGADRSRLAVSSAMVHRSPAERLVGGRSVEPRDLVVLTVRVVVASEHDQTRPYVRLVG